MFNLFLLGLGLFIIAQLYEYNESFRNYVDKKISIIKNFIKEKRK